MKAAVVEVTARIPLRYWVVFLVLFLTNIYVAVSSAAFGSQLVSLEKEMKKISEENKVLMEQLVAHQSLQNVSQKAEELGMLNPVEVVYLNTPTSLSAAF